MFLLRAMCGAAALLVIGAGTAAAQSAADSAAIRQTALDYIEGWYAGDSARMSRSLHPDLAKRIPRQGSAGGSTRLDHMTAAQLVGITAGGGGRQTSPGERRGEVRILDIFGNTASVRLDAKDWVDYMHIARVDGRWVIVNVLWEMRR